MRQPLSSVLPETDADRDDRPAHHPRAPVVERIAGWSARHRKTAVFGWLALVAVVFLAGQALGTKSLPSYDAGQAGRAEQTLHRLGVNAPAVEDVLIQARGASHTFAADPAMGQAAREVAGALARLPHAATDIRSPLSAGNRPGFRGRPQRPGHVPCPRPGGRPGHGAGTRPATSRSPASGCTCTGR